MREWRKEVERRLRGAGLDGGTERDIVDELAAHLQDRYAELRADGLSADAARADALAELGDDDSFAGLVGRTVSARPEPVSLGRPARGDGPGGWWSDIRFAVRTLLRAPAYAGIVVLVIALGIGVNTVMFTALNTVLLRPPPGVENARELAAVYTSDFSGPRYGGSSYPDYEAVRDEQGLFESAAVHTAQSWGVATHDWSAQVMGEVVSANYFEVLGVSPAAGRFFGADEAGAAGTSTAVVISHDLWQWRFGGAADAIGAELRVRGEPLEVIGVAAREFSGLLPGTRAQLWVPMSASPAVTNENPRHRGSRGLAIIGRVAEGVNLGAVQSKLDVVAARLHSEFPEEWTDVNRRPRVFTAVPEAEARVPRAGRGPIIGFMALLMGAVLTVLLVACTNVANLMLSRASARRAEMGIRIALGASRGRIVRHLLAESLMLAGLGGSAGVLLAAAFTARLEATRLALPVPVALDVALDVRVLAFATAITLLTGLLFGLAPALQASRAPTPMLKDDARSGTRLRFRHALVVFQVAASLVLLVVGGVFTRSLYAAHRIDTGFDVEDVVLARFALGPEGYTDQQSASFYDEVLARASALPGATAAALAETVPLGIGWSRRSVSVAEYEPQPGEDMEVLYNGVTPGYFAAMGVELRVGREFTAADGPEAPPVVIVTEAFARRFWPGENPLGKRVAIQARDRYGEVVGVAEDAKYRNLLEEPEPYIYYPYLQGPSPHMLLLVRTSAETDLVVNEVRGVVRSLAPALPPPTVQTFEQHMAAAMMPQRIAAGLLSGLGVFAIAIAAIGLYGLVAFGVAQRAHEFGVRMALGALAGDVHRLVLGDALRLALIGIVAGLPVAAGVALLAGRFLVVRPVDPFAFLGVPMLLALCALLAAFAPARRATRQDPAATLRTE
jgi:predicted permease